MSTVRFSKNYSAKIDKKQKNLLKKKKHPKNYKKKLAKWNNFSTVESKRKDRKKN